MAALRRHGALTRADLTRRTGLSHPTVTKIVDALCVSQILEEGESIQPALGRPGKTVALASRESCVVSLIIGAHRCSLISSGIDGIPREDQADTFPTPESYEELLKQVAARIEDQFVRESVHILGLGICLPGLLDANNETVLICPNLRWMEGKQPGLDLEKRLSFPTTLVQAMAAHYFFESRFGEARGMDDFVVINYAGGLGAVASSGGKMVEGQGGLAGELGHITIDVEGGILCGCGNRGCLETVASDRAVLLAASGQRGQTLTLPEVIDQVQSGSDEFDAILEKAGRYLAVGLAAAVNIFNPEAIFIYGKFLHAQEGLFERVVDWTRECSLKLSSEQCKILQPNRDSHQCQQIGAAAAIIEKLTTAAAVERATQKEVAA